MATLEKQEHEALQRAGANACASGVSQFDCPLFKADRVPAATGEAPEVWSAKVEAWTLG